MAKLDASLTNALREGPEGVAAIVVCSGDAEVVAAALRHAGVAVGSVLEDFGIVNVTLTRETGPAVETVDGIEAVELDDEASAL